MESQCSFKSRSFSVYCVRREDLWLAWKHNRVVSVATLASESALSLLRLPECADIHYRSIRLSLTMSFSDSWNSKVRAERNTLELKSFRAASQFKSRKLRICGEKKLFKKSVVPSLHTPSDILKVINTPRTHGLTSFPKTPTIYLLCFTRCRIHNFWNHSGTQNTFRNKPTVYLLQSTKFTHFSQFGNTSRHSPLTRKT